MDWSRRSVRLLAIGLVFVVLSSAHWIWAASQGYETKTAMALFVGGVLAVDIALLWMRRERNRIQ
jgi:hypothetical protein